MEPKSQKPGYIAVWEYIPGEKATIVLPRGKGNFFATVELAAKALEGRARKTNTETRGIVKNRNGEVVFTIAL